MTSCWNWFSSFITWSQRSGLAVGSFAHGAISPALRVFIVFIYVCVPELAHVEVRGQLKVATSSVCPLMSTGGSVPFSHRVGPGIDRYQVTRLGGRRLDPSSHLVGTNPVDSHSSACCEQRHGWLFFRSLLCWMLAVSSPGRQHLSFSGAPGSCLRRSIDQSARVSFTGWAGVFGVYCRKQTFPSV